jgi:hypothetical protein
VLALSEAEVLAAVRRLAGRGAVVDDCVVAGWPGRWLVCASAFSARSAP